MRGVDSALRCCVYRWLRRKAREGAGLGCQCQAVSVLFHMEPWGGEVDPILRTGIRHS